jgi:hypothetical protein
MAHQLVLTFLVLNVACFLANGGTTRVLVTNVSHMIGYEAASPFEHVKGSACCLDLSLQAHDVEACKRYCVASTDCGSFLYSAAERACFLISQDSNFEPADDVNGCQRRCAEREACEAFVYALSTRLCFLIRFPQQGPAATSSSASIRHAGDRIFGLVRDCPAGGLQAAITSSLSEVGVKGEDIPRGIEIERNASSLSPLSSSITSVVNGSFNDVSRVQFHPVRLLGTERNNAINTDSGIGESWFSDALLGTVLAVITLIVFAALICLLGKAAVATERPRIAELSILPETHCEEVVAPNLAAEPGMIDAGHVPARKPSNTLRGNHGASLGKTIYILREIDVNAPARRRVDVAGPTNYPVAGEASPYAGGRPQKLLFRESAAHVGTREASDAVNLVDERCAEQQLVLEPVASTSHVAVLGAPEIGLILGTLLFGALKHEWMDIISIVFALLCIMVCLGYQYLHSQVSDHSVESAAGEGTSSSAIKPSHNAQEQDSIDKVASKSEHEAPLLSRRMPSDIRTSKGGG